MIETNRVVVHFDDGSILKGKANDFFPNRPSFHLEPLDGGGTVEVQCDHLKAVFFVRNFGGDPQRTDLMGFMARPLETSRGNKIVVRFKDRELLFGYCMTYRPDKQGFVVFPADPRSNNLRVYVLTAATDSVHTGPAANTFLKGIRATGRAS